MPTDEEEIRALVATWMEATKAGDTDKVLSLMTDDVVFLLPGQPPMLGKASFAAAAGAAPKEKGKAPLIDGQSEIQEIQVMGDWAFMWTRLKVMVTPPDGTTTLVRAGHTLSILCKLGGRWLLARDANLLAPVRGA